MKTLLSLLLTLTFFSCKTEVKDSNAKYKNLVSGEGNVAYQEARAVLVNRCFKCHEADGSHNYGSETEESWTQNAEISPGNPEDSQLYTSLSRGMPADGTSLSPGEKKKIYDWIAGMNKVSGPDIPVISDSSPQFEAAYQVIYQYCVPCHSASNSNNISSFEFPSQKGWANSGLIASQSAEGSLLYQRIVDGSMPPDPISKSLSASEVSKIETWLNSFQFAAGNGGGGGGGGGNTGMNADQRMANAQQLLANRCSGCHTGGGNAGGFNFGTLLNAGTTYAEWDAAATGGNQLFEPGNPNASRIFIVLRNSGQQPADMPTNAAQAFNAAEIGQLRNWILMGNDP